MKHISAILVSAFVVLVLPVHAQAYLDPGGLSFVFQMILVGAATALIAVRGYYRRIQIFMQDIFQKVKDKTAKKKLKDK